jgi:predicted ATP-dependent endonuclease of OLD family
MGITIHSLDIENVKRVKAVSLTPAAKGLTVIGGKNGAGKTTVLDAIVWALGGEKYRPSEAQRDGSMTPPHIRITLSNGLVVERKGKNSALTVTDPSGKKAGQQLLNEFISQLALDLPRFMQANAKEKADTLLQILGIGPQLRALDDEIARIYNQRTTVGQIRDQKAAHAAELPEYADAPAEEISVAELLNRHKSILARNAENEKNRNALTHMKGQEDLLRAQIKEMTEKLNAKIREQNELLAAIREAERTVAELRDENTAEIEKDIENIEQTNAQVRANLTKEHAQAEADDEAERYKQLTRTIEDKRADRMRLLEGADLPLPGLTVEDGELKYNGHSWDCMSGSEQLRVATAIVRRLNPACGFVLLDKLEQMDEETLIGFGSWLEAEGLQAIATRVSTGSECQVIIENGMVKGADEPDELPKWKKGEF